ncbi:MAG TPA: sugar phosphate isomerase/epimerase family protein [Bryobacteraceae bacterium]|nr:sugar phosphate isomerase/epimerase family protein [Bryobacteraceae bacterium]
MFWAGGEPAQTIAELKELGIHSGQLGIPGDLDFSCAPRWRDALRAAGFRIYTVFAAYNGESYADVPTVQRTVGFVPPATRAERERRTLEVSDFAAAIGAPGIATHIGFVPESPSDPDYIAVRDMVRRVADHAASHNQTFALETGQEPAKVLMAFLNDVGRANLGINFDPANMILYGTGDPIEALGILAPKVLTVHCKDGDWPEAGVPGALGHEKALGAGSVGIPRFLAKLREIGYRGPLSIEREASDPAQRMADIRSAIVLLTQLKA